MSRRLTLAVLAAVNLFKPFMNQGLLWGFSLFLSSVTLCLHVGSLFISNYQITTTPIPKTLCAVHISTGPRGSCKEWSNMCVHPDDVFLWDVAAYFSRTVKPHPAELQQHGCAGKDWPASTSRENVQNAIWRKTWQQKPRTVEQLKVNMKQEQDRVPRPILQRPLSSVPRRWRRVDAAQR